ncbi:MAG TPA: ATP-binding protein [Pirellulales bacterium]|jgi:two-component system phosphate regulon sensor histidine kinase PhoR|nr:ATP-binding protein [Pirellulales bacterium]
MPEMSACPENCLRVNIDSKGKAFLLIATICAIAFLSTWATGLIVTPESNWPFRYRFLGVEFVLGMGGTYLWVRRVGQQQIEAQRYFKALAQVDPLKLAQGTLASDLPAMMPTNPWNMPAGDFTHVFRTLCDRVDQAEHARSALEVRGKRNAARQAQIEAILTALPEAVIAVDAGDQLILANPAAEQLLGLDLQANANRHITQILHCEKLIELVGEMRRRKAPRQRSIEIELTDEDSKPRCYGATACRLGAHEQRGEESQPAGGVFVVLRDMTLLKASHKRNAEFVSAVSHEMKTPLAGIKAYVELLADGDAEDTQTREEFLNVINGQANRLQRLIDNLLNLARIEAGVVQVSKGASSLNELLQEAFDLVRPAAEAKQIEHTIDLSQMYIGVWVDRDMIMQAAINLLSNAIKYTPDGGRVTLRSRMADQEAIFEVEDSGVGLCEEDQVRVFEKFYRVKKDRDMASGTGLGLPLAKHIVEDVHSGRLTVDSQLGQGSTFCVVLPAAAQMTTHV